jgi:hypothetical protein
LPLWSELRIVHDAIATGRVPRCVVIGPTTPDDFWAPHLGAIQTAASRAQPLGRAASTPPRPGATRDPRPLTAYLVGFTPILHLSRRPPSARAPHGGRPGA